MTDFAEVREGIETAAQIEEGERTLRILGSEARLEAMGNVWTTQATSLQIIAAHCLLEFANGENYSAQEMAFFRLGLSKIPEFLARCAEDVRKRKKPLDKSEGL